MWQWGEAGTLITEGSEEGYLWGGVRMLTPRMGPQDKYTWI